MREDAREQPGGDAEVGGGRGAADDGQGHLKVLTSLHKFSLEDSKSIGHGAAITTTLHVRHKNRGITVEPLYRGHFGGPSKVSCIERCPHIRGKFLLRKHIWVTAKCPEYRGVLISECPLREVPL